MGTRHLTLVQESASQRFKRRLKELRRERRWSQEKAAEICGIGQKMFQLYELGVKDNPSLKQLEKIAFGFGLDVSELIINRSDRSSKKRKLRTHRSV